jgi:hypothetical protein
MKHLKLIILLASALSCSAWADLDSDLRGLGGNKELIRRARGLDPKNKVSVVQNRAVDRDLRLELGINYGLAGALIFTSLPAGP